MSTIIAPPDNALAFLKADLGFFDAELPTDLQRYLQGLIFTAGERIRDAGINLSPGQANDDQFTAMYAAWLYRSRVTGDGMPQMLKRELANRQVREATAGDS